MKKPRKMNNYSDLEVKLGIKFKDITILEKAFTHRSYLNEHRGEGLENNERLEFLGDAVLELIISSYLYKNYPEKSEGELTNIRAAVVRTESLAEESRNLDFGKYLRMSKGEEDSGGKDKDYLLANTFEAVLGAIYLDQGFNVCIEYLGETLLHKVSNIVEKNLFIDPKTQAQELIQAQFKVTPLYEVIKEEGPDHDKKFTVALKVNQKEMGRGSGSSKQKAEEEAAKMAIDTINNEEKSLN
jgi:ribonuclease-3